MKLNYPVESGSFQKAIELAKGFLEGEEIYLYYENGGGANVTIKKALSGGMQVYGNVEITLETTYAPTRDGIGYSGSYPVARVKNNVLYPTALEGHEHTTQYTLASASVPENAKNGLFSLSVYTAIAKAMDFKKAPYRQSGGDPSFAPSTPSEILAISTMMAEMDLEGLYKRGIVPAMNQSNGARGYYSSYQNRFVYWQWA